MTVGSLFAGIGGFDLAFEWAGFEIRWQVEKDEFCQKVLAKHWPNVQRHGDIHECRDLPTVDVVCGGFPCQPFSQAGRQKGTEDDRYLWPEMLRVIREVRPRYVVGENVVGLTSMQDGLVFEQVLSDLEDEGYEIESLVIPACAVDAPHRRDRLWIVAYSGGERRQQITGGPHGNEGTYEGRPSPQAHVAASGREGCRTWDLGNSNGPRAHASSAPSGSRRAASKPGRWQAEPELDRVANGLPSQVDRNRAIGNAIVPQVAYPIALAIRRHMMEPR